MSYYLYPSDCSNFSCAWISPKSQSASQILSLSLVVVDTKLDTEYTGYTGFFSVHCPHIAWPLEASSAILRQRTSHQRLVSSVLWPSRMSRMIYPMSSYIMWLKYFLIHLYQSQRADITLINGHSGKLVKSMPLLSLLVTYYFIDSFQFFQ